MDRPTDWIRAIGVPLLICVLTFLALQVALERWAGGPNMLRSDVIARINDQAGAPSGGGFLGAAPANEDALAVQLETYRQNIIAGFYDGVLWLIGAALLLSVLWCAFALWRQKEAFGPRKQQSAWPAWALAAILYLIAVIAVVIFVLGRLDLREMMVPTSYWGLIMLISIVGFLAFWVSTGFGASPVMKPSLPLGTRLPV